MREPTVEVNDLIDVQIPNDIHSLAYKSRIDDIDEDGILNISWPTDNGVPIPIRQNQTLTISYMRDDAVYTFSGIVEDREREPIARILMRPAGPPERIQRRHFFRVKTALSVELIYRQAVGAGDSAPRNSILRWKTYDISGSGLSIRHSDAIPDGTLLDCNLMLPSEGSAIKILCKVTHSEPISQGSKESLYHIGMYYLSINDPDRTRIVRHVFKVEQARLHNS
jgi:c-di-GMP-binding flagellar brake protein YcgR